jgi:hypothetical protein
VLARAESHLRRADETVPAEPDRQVAGSGS